MVDSFYAEKQLVSVILQSSAAFCSPIRENTRYENSLFVEERQTVDALQQHLIITPQIPTAIFFRFCTHIRWFRNLLRRRLCSFLLTRPRTYSVITESEMRSTVCPLRSLRSRVDDYSPFRILLFDRAFRRRVSHAEQK
jgi:hypothetical protein